MVRHTIRTLVSLLVMLSSSVGGVAAQRVTVAVLPFENGGSFGQDQEDYDALRLGIAALLGSELGRLSTAEVVNRASVVGVLRREGFATTQQFDAASATKVGVLAGARWLIAGTFVDLYGDFRIDARILDVETGRVVKLVRSDPKLGDRQQLAGIISSVADRVVEAAGLGATVAPRSKRNLPTDAVVAFSKGLLYEDAGDTGTAADHYRQAISAAREFAEAQDGLNRARGSS